MAKTLDKLRQHFYWPGCRKDTELFVHCCDSCTAKKGPTGHSHAPSQQYQVGDPMDRVVGVDILGPFPTTDSGNRCPSTASWPWTISLSGKRMGVSKTRTMGKVQPDAGNWLSSPHDTSETGFATYPLSCGRISVQESMGCTPATLMFGRELRTPVDISL